MRRLLSVLLVVFSVNGLMVDPCDTTEIVREPFSFKSQIHSWKICLSGAPLTPLEPDIADETAANSVARPVESTNWDANAGDFVWFASSVFATTPPPVAASTDVTNSTGNSSDVCAAEYNCQPSSRGNLICDVECYNEMCNFDSGDCTKVCICPNGRGAVGHACPASGEELCVQCSDGYHIELTSCLRNACKCENGMPAVDVGCVEHNRFTCASCSYGYHLLRDSCYPNECRCTNGVGAVGPACGHGAEEVCVSCKALYSLIDMRCTMIYHVYSNALCFDSTLHYMPSVYDNDTMDLGSCRGKCDDPACAAFTFIPMYEAPPRTEEERVDEIARHGKLLYDPGTELPHVNGCYRWLRSSSVYAMRVNYTLGMKFAPICAIKVATSTLSYSVKVTFGLGARVNATRFLRAVHDQGRNALEPLKEHVQNAIMVVWGPNNTITPIQRIYPDFTDNNSSLRRLANVTVPRAEMANATMPQDEVATVTVPPVEVENVWIIMYNLTLPNRYALEFWQRANGPDLLRRYLQSFVTHNIIPAAIVLQNEVLSVRVETSNAGPSVGVVPPLFLQPDANCQVSFEEGHTCISSENFPDIYPDSHGSQCVAVFVDTREMLVLESFYTKPGDFLKFDRIYSEVRRPMFAFTGAGKRMFWKIGKEEVVPVVPPPEEPFTESVGFGVLMIVVVYVAIALSPFGVWCAVPYKVRLDKASHRLVEKDTLFVNWSVADGKISLFGCTQDFNACMCGFFCPAIRAAHTYDKANWTAFWVTFARWVLCPPYGIACSARNRLKLLALVRNQPPFFSRYQVFTEAILMVFCFPCAVIQEGRMVDEASQMVVSCPMSFSDSIDGDDLLGKPVRLVDIDALMQPRVKITGADDANIASETPDQPRTPPMIQPPKRNFWAAANTVLAQKALDTAATLDTDDPHVSKQEMRRNSMRERRRSIASRGMSREKPDRPTLKIAPEDSALTSRERLIAYFEFLDVQQAGGINYKEFMQFLNAKYQVQTTSGAMQRILADVDKNMDGIIDREEFLDFFAELDSLVSFAQNQGLQTQRNKCTTLWMIFGGASTAVVLVLSVMAMLRQCGLVCKASGDGLTYGCPRESRPTCWSECLKLRPLGDYIAREMYSSLVAIISGILLILCFIGASARVFIFTYTGRKKKKIVVAEEVSPWDNVPNVDISLHDYYGMTQYKKATRFLDKQELAALTQSYFNPMQWSSYRMGLEKPQELIAIDLGDDISEESEEPIAWIRPDQAETYFIEDIPDPEREQRVEDNKQWEEWMDRFSQRNHAKEIADANTAHELGVALKAARYANAEGLEEHELRLEKWKSEKENEEANREAIKQEFTDILSDGLEKDTEQALREAIATVDAKFGKTSLLVIGSHQYKLCTVRLHELRFGSTVDAFKPLKLLP